MVHDISTYMHTYILNFQDTEDSELCGYFESVMELKLSYCKGATYVTALTTKLQVLYFT